MFSPHVCCANPDISARRYGSYIRYALTAHRDVQRVGLNVFYAALTGGLILFSNGQPKLMAVLLNGTLHSKKIKLAGFVKR